MIGGQLTFKNFDIINKLSTIKHWEKKILETNVQIGQILVNDVTVVMNTGVRTGRKYPAGIRRGRRYVAGRHSSPSEPIKSMTGETSEKTYSTATSNQINFGSKAPYSGEPEYGIGMSPRKTFFKEYRKKEALLTSKLETNIINT